MKKLIVDLCISMFCGAVAVSACGGALSATDLGNLAKDDAACTADAATKAADDACRAKVYAAFCASHPGVGDTCAADGGVK